jgi:type II secretory ATPase GspE/PulE/Tfp pilus assembly ATPase PilB-like protein
LVQGYGVSGWDRLGQTYTEHFTLYKEKGCEMCNGTGFKGRVPLHELLRATEDMKSMIQSQTKLAGLRELAVKEGMMTLVQDGIQKTLQGITTYRQVRAVAIK